MSDQPTPATCPDDRPITLGVDLTHNTTRPGPDAHELDLDELALDDAFGL